MPKHVTIKQKIKPFNKVIKVPGDKSLSIRWALLASQAIGKSKAYNLLRSEDVLLKAITVAPASANAIEQALPSPFPAPVTKAYLFLRFIF